MLSNVAYCVILIRDTSNTHMSTNKLIYHGVECRTTLRPIVHCTMRSLLFVGITILASLVKAQGILPILYYTPPTMGCDGVIAFDLPTWNGCVGGGSGPWICTPVGCAVKGAWASGDTAFVQVCSEPCNVVVFDDFGTACMCSVGFPTSLDESPQAAGLRISRSSNGLTISSPITLTSPTCRIVGNTGQLILEQGLNSGSWWQLAHVPEGQVLIVTITSKEQTFVGRF